MNVKSFGAALALIGLGTVASAQGTEQTAQGPVRLAHISSVQGDVTWRAADSSDWSRASANIPIRQGAQIWANGSGKSEVQFDDGSVMRMGLGAVATMESFFSDKDGEFTEIKVNSGTVSFHTKNQYSVYQVDTPFASVKATGATRFRVDVDKSVSVGVRLGRVGVSSKGGDTELRTGDYLTLADENDRGRVVDLPRHDTWDAYDDSREGIYGSDASDMPANIAIVADFGGYGHWRHHSHYGNVWYPSVAVDWQPYRDGSWVWCDPFGWTWCSNEAWGWAPYHYGTWIHEGREWGWCPGPAHQYWSPAVVHFTSFNGDYCWAPLCPEEVRYPVGYGFGYGRGGWWMDFSIGGCCAYCPVDGGLCDPILFDFTFFIGGGRGFDRFGGDWRRFHDDHGFIPRNSRFGAVTADAGRFGQGGAFHSVNHDATSMWKHGESVTASNHAFSGPVMARPSASSGTPSHTFESGRQPQSLDRALYRSSVRSDVERTSEPFGRTTQSSSGSRSGRDEGGRGRSVGSAASGSNDPADRARQARESLGYSGRSGQSYGSSRSTESAGSSDRGSRGYDRSSQSSGSSDRGPRDYDRYSDNSGRSSRTSDRSTQSSGGSHSSDRSSGGSSSGGGGRSGGGGGDRGDNGRGH